MTDPRPRRYRAPTEDGAALIDPPLSEVTALVAANRAAAGNRDSELGVPAGFCKAARRGLLGGVFGNEPGAAEIDVDRPFILAGHQPTLFHPGVWLKNFLLSSITQRVGGTAVNLVVDNDIAHTLSIRVPYGAQTVDIPFDRQDELTPWETRRLKDIECFRDFPRQVHAALRHVALPESRLLLDRLWPLAEQVRQEEFARSQDVLRRNFPDINVDDPGWRSIANIAGVGHCLATARHRLEEDLGLSTNQVAIGAPGFWMRFLEFAELLIRRHRQLWQTYNSALARYRLLNGVRSDAHPVPELVRDGDWYEVPLWLWSHDSPRRRRVFVREAGNSWELTDRERIVFNGGTASEFQGLTRLQSAEIEHFKLRPRALITTMYARLVLSDLFIHGIGGAKYDELTDEIIRRFFGIEPPAYLTATATFRLQIDRPQVTIEDVRDCVRRIRDVRYRAESFVGDPLLAHEPQIASQLQSLAADKREYVRSHTLRRSSEEVFAGLDRINRTMHELLHPVEEHLRREHARLIEEARRARVLGSREFSFVLFPEEYLVPRLLALAQVPA